MHSLEKLSFGSRSGCLVCSKRTPSLNALVYEYGTKGADNSAADLPSRRLLLLRALEASPQTDVAEQSVREILERVSAWDSKELVASLEVDGFEFRDKKLVATPVRPRRRPRLARSRPTCWRAGLRSLSNTIGKRWNNFTDGNFEAANGQLRAAFEDVMPRAWPALLGSNPDNPTAALQQLRNAGRLDDAEFNTFCSFWSGIQDNGPHAGLTTADEALYRLHSGTAIARYLLQKQ